MIWRKKSPQEKLYEKILEQLEDFMSSVPPGLAALEAAQTALTTAINNAIAEIKSLASQIAGTSAAEDPAVANIASALMTLANDLQAAIPAPPVAAPAAPTAAATGEVIKPS